MLDLWATQPGMAWLYWSAAAGASHAGKRPALPDVDQALR